MKILVFGNPDISKDSLPVRLIAKLNREFPDIEFIHLDGIDEIQEHGKNLIIIDSVQGIKNCIVLRDPNMISGKVLSLHEFNLADNLILLKRVKLIDSFLVFCVPMRISESNALKQLKNLIKKEMKI